METPEREDKTCRAEDLYPPPVLASLDALKAIVDNHAYAHFVWPGEEYVTDDEGYYGCMLQGVWCEPLIVDAFTAGAMMAVYDALKPANQNSFATMVAQSRARFCRLVDFTWEHVR